MVVPLLPPVNRRLVHLVDEDDQGIDTEALDEMGMLASLPSPFEPSLELAIPGRDDQGRNIGLRRAFDHVRDVFLVAWGVKDRKAPHLGLEEDLADLNGLTLLAFLGVDIDDVCLPPALSLHLLGVILELSQLVLIDIIGFDKDGAAGC